MRLLFAIIISAHLVAPVTAATYFIGHAGYAGPEASDPNYRNYDDGSFSLQTFAATLVANDVVEFVDATAPYAKESAFLSPTAINLTFRGKTGQDIVIQSDGATNNNPVGAPRSGMAVAVGPAGLSFQHLTFRSKPGDQAAFVVWGGETTFLDCHLDADPGDGYTAGLTTVANGTSVTLNSCLVESQVGEAIGFWQAAGTPAHTITMNNTVVRGGTFATTPPMGQVFNTGCLTSAGNVYADKCFFYLGETHIPITFFAYVNGAEKHFTRCVFKMTVSDSFATPNGGGYIAFMSSIVEPIPAAIATDVVFENCDFVGQGNGSLTAVRSLWQSTLFTLRVEKCIATNFLWDFGSGPNGFIVWDQPATYAKTTVNHNVLLGTPSDPTIGPYFYFGINQDPTDIELAAGDPLYNDAAADDYRLAPGSLAATIATGDDPPYAGSQGPIASAVVDWALYDNK